MNRLYTLIIENEKGEQLKLTDNPNYDVLSVEGTNPPKADINTVTVSGSDGSRFNSSRLSERNLVITLNIRPPTEENRIYLYKYFRVKHTVRIYYRIENRNAYIDGYVESFENNPFTPLQQPQISVICPEPYWKELDELIVNFSNTINLFSFPFSIESQGIEFSRIEHFSQTIINTGDVATGGIIRFYATAQVSKPVFHNYTNDTFFGLDMDLYEGDSVIINTQKGEKSLTLLRGGMTLNILSERSENSSWIVFEAGENQIGYTADEGADYLDINVEIVRKYEGM